MQVIAKYDVRAGPGPVLDRIRALFLLMTLLAVAVFNVGCLSSFRALVLQSQAMFVIPG